MKNLFIIAMLVLGTGFAQAQTSDTMEMPTDMNMPMADMPTEMDMLADKAHMTFMAYVDATNAASEMCMTKCTEKDMMIMDLKMYMKHSKMVLSKKQMTKIKMMMKMEMDMKMDKPMNQ